MNTKVMIATKESFLFSTFHIFNTLFIESSASTLENLNFLKNKMDWGFFSNSYNTDFKSWKIAFDDARSKKTLKYILPLAPDCSWLVTALNREPLQELVPKTYW